MGTITKKKIKGNNYYYYVESRRINGKPRIVNQVYLGTAEKVLKDTQEGQRPKEARHQSFGDVAALYEISDQLGIIQTINSAVDKKVAGVSVGEYFLIAAINRACEASSKNDIVNWYKRTTLEDIMKIGSNKLTSQNFWEAMDGVDEADILKIEESIWRRLYQRWGVNLDLLMYDTTNFANYLDTKTESILSQRGKNKQGRDHLRQIGLALAVTKEFGLPIFHMLYPGNCHDARLFPTAISALVDRTIRITKGVYKLTLVFDKGMNSKDNFSLLRKKRVSFIGSLKPSDHKELLRIDKGHFLPLPDSSDTFYETRKEVFGAKRRIIITYSDKLYRRKLHNLERRIKAARDEIRALIAMINAAKAEDVPGKRGRKKGDINIDAHIKEILRKRRVKDLLVTTVSQQEDKLSVSIVRKTRAVEALKKTSGKTLLFTDRDDMAPEEIVFAYRGKNVVEDAYKQMNDPKTVPFSPVYHWTDQKIRVHAFICVIALLLVKVMHMLMKKNTELRMNIPTVLEELNDIRVIILIYSISTCEKMLSGMSKIQKRLFSLYSLQKYSPG
jgi:transposase